MNTSLITSLVNKYQTTLKERNLELHKISKETGLKEIVPNYVCDDDSDWKNIDYILKNKHDKKFLEQFNCKKSGCYHKEWKCHDITCSVSKILLKTNLVRNLICMNNLGLPNEIWEIICDFIENEIKFFIPAFIEFDNDIEIFLQKAYCFNLSEKFIEGYECVKNPKGILEYINVGDIAIAGCCRSDCFFSIIVDIDIEHGLVTTIEKLDQNDRYLRFGKSGIIENTLYLKGRTQTRTFDFHDFLFSSTVKSDIEVHISKTYLNYTSY